MINDLKLFWILGLFLFILPNLSGDRFFKNTEGQCSIELLRDADGLIYLKFWEYPGLTDKIGLL
jgi:hypothetical protein